MGLQIEGYEKAIAALLGGGMATAANVLALWAVSSTGAFPSPGPEAIAGAVTGVVASVFAATGAYLATNTPAAEPPDQPPAA